MTRARTIPAYTAEGLDDPAQEETTGEITRILPIPTIQREMPSPERKRSRRGGRVIIDDEDEDVDDSSDSE